MNIDKAGKSYWDHLWGESPLLNAVDPHVSGLNNYVNRKFHEYFQKVFSGMDTDGKRLLEIGCARSQWLPYFNKEFGFEVTGVDYSEVGCEMAQAILEKQGVKGTVSCEDFFAPSKMLIEEFDVVVSFGVAEHFQDTIACISAFSRFLKPGGIIITSVPNVTGIVGLLQKKLNKQVYDKHVPLDVHMLGRAHVLSGFKDLRCDYFLSNHLGMINLNGLNPQERSTRIKALLVLNLIRASKAVWKIEEIVGNFPTSKLLSPFIICSGRITL